MCKIRQTIKYALLAGGILFSVSQLFGFDIVKGGKPVSVLMVPDNPTILEKEGAETIVKYVKMASGVSLPIKKESEKVNNKNIIALGKTKLAEKKKITDRDLKYDGYHIKVKDNVLFLVGRDDEIMKAPKGQGDRIGAQGSRRVALALMEQLGFRWLQPGPEGFYIPKSDSMSIPDNIDITYNPILMYLAGRMYTWGDWSLANGYRKAVKIFSSGGHTWPNAVKKEFYKEHPEYFKLRNGKRLKPSKFDYQICNSNPDCIKLVEDYTIDKMKKGYDIVALGQTDAWRSCQCKNCLKLSDGKEGNQAWDQIHLPNYQIIQNVLKKYPDRYIHLLLYGPTRTPSEKIKEYPDNVIGEVCRFDEKQLQTWASKLKGGLTLYLYKMRVYGGVALAPKFTPAMAKRLIDKSVKYNVKGIYWCGGGENFGAEGPTYYAIGRLFIDPSRSWESLLKEYCDLTFGKAAGIMYQYYKLLYERIDLFMANYIPRRKYTEDYMAAVYTPEVIDKFNSYLTQAFKLAKDDKKALGWLRVVRISCDQVCRIAKVYHLYRAYNLHKSIHSLAALKEAVDEYNRYVNETLAIPKTDPAFYKKHARVLGWFVRKDSKIGGGFKDNYNTLKSPFNWNFNKLISSNTLPGASRRKIVIHKINKKPEIDGCLTDNIWKNIEPDDLKEINLGDKEASTSFKAAHDGKNMYFAFECNEPRIDEMVVREMGRDGKVYNTECVEILLSPDGNGNKYVQFCVSPTKDGVWDGRYGYIDDPEHPLVIAGKADKSWNSNIKHAYNIDKKNKKWTVEMAIPLASFVTNPPETGTRWRGNFGRERHLRLWDHKKYSKSELHLWNPNLQGGGFISPAAFGDICFD